MGQATRDLTEYGALLAMAGLDLMACRSDDEVFAIAHRFFDQLVPGVIVITSKATEDQAHLVTIDLLGVDQRMVEQAARLTGFEIKGRKSPVVRSISGRFAQRTLVKVPGGLGEVASTEMPQAAADVVAAAFGIRDVYTIGIADEDTIFGTITFLMRQQDEPLPGHVIESFVYQCFLTLSNMKKELALRRNERRFRVLTESMKDVVWILDPETLRFLYVSPSVLGLRGYTPEEVMAEPMDAALTPDGSALVRATLQERIKGVLTGESLGDGFHIEELEQPCKDGSSVWTEVITRYHLNEETGRVEVHGVTRDISRRRRVEADLVESNRRLEGMLYSVAEAMGRVVEARDPYTQGHEMRVARLAKDLAREMGLQENEVAGVEMAAVVHDIGKLSVPADILNKPGTLSANEFGLIKRHSRAGYEILKDIDFPWPVAESVLHHHERLDGSGYPDGLIGDQISITARILAVADVVEAMASHRPYRPALGLEAAVAEVAQHPEKFDPDVIAACLRLYEAGRITW